MFTFSSMKSKFVVAAVVAAGAMVVPAAASAVTSPPPLQAGDTQAFASFTSGGPRITSPITRTFQGSLTFSLGAFQVTCTNVQFGVQVNVDGTTLVETATFAGCTTGCNVVVSAAGLGWGNRLVRDSGGVFRDRINVGPAPGSGVVISLSAGCPVPPGSFGLSGIVSPSVTGGTGVGASRSSLTFNASSGTLSSPVLGPFTVTGTLVGTMGQPLFIVL